MFSLISISLGNHILISSQKKFRKVWELLRKPAFTYHPKLWWHTATLLSQLKVLDIFSINSFSVGTFMYSYHQIFCLVSSSFHDLFLSSNEVHQYETWLASQYRPHFCRTNMTQFSILYRGPKIWNSLPVSLISSPSIFVFKKI